MTYITPWIAYSPQGSLNARWRQHGDVVELSISTLAETELDLNNIVPIGLILSDIMLISVEPREFNLSGHQMNTKIWNLIGILAISKTVSNE